MKKSSLCGYMSRKHGGETLTRQQGKRNKNSISNKFAIGPEESAEHINESFTSLKSKYSEVREEWFSVDANSHLPTIPVESVLKELKKLNKYSTGHIGSRFKIIKYFASYFANPLTHIFSESFIQPVFLDIWKISRVFAIPKVNHALQQNNCDQLH